MCQRLFTLLTVHLSTACSGLSVRCSKSLTYHTVQRFARKLWKGHRRLNNTSETDFSKPLDRSHSRLTAGCQKASIRISPLLATTSIHLPTTLRTGYLKPNNSHSPTLAAATLEKTSLIFWFRLLIATLFVRRYNQQIHCIFSSNNNVGWLVHG